MRVLSINKVQPGMKIGRTIYGSNGDTLLNAGVELSTKYLDRLAELGITALYIQDESTDAIEIDDVVSEKTRLEAVKFIKEVMSNIKLHPSFDVKKVNEVVNNIINELLVNKDLVVNIIDIRAMNDYTFGHSVNVAILSIITGIALGLDQEKLKKLAAGALFHDIGKTVISEQIINNRGTLTEEEEELKQKHTLMGFEILRKIDGFSITAAHVALQHHERYDGTGYPRGLKGKEINEFARIVTVADLYDKMTSGGLGPRCMPFQALELIMVNSGKFFDPQIIEVFMKIIAIFPLGTMVLLNTKEKAIITEISKKYPTRPRVRVIVNQEGKDIKPPYEIDLFHNTEYFITRVLEEGE